MQELSPQNRKGSAVWAGAGVGYGEHHMRTRTASPTQTLDVLPRSSGDALVHCRPGKWHPRGAIGMKPVCVTWAMGRASVLGRELTRAAFLTLSSLRFRELDSIVPLDLLDVPCGRPPERQIRRLSRTF